MRQTSNVLVRWEQKHNIWKSPKQDTDSNCQGEWSPLCLNEDSMLPVAEVLFTKLQVEFLHLFSSSHLVLFSDFSSIS